MRKRKLQFIFILLGTVILSILTILPSPDTGVSTTMVQYRPRTVCDVYVEDSKRNLSVVYNVFNYDIISDVIVTMTAHTTVDRFKSLEKVAQMWKGPMSVAVYATAEEFSDFKRNFLKSSFLTARRNIYVHVAESKGLYYPVNSLRNAAIDFCTWSRFIFLNDIDFVPSMNLEQQILLHISEGSLMGKTALIIPAFEDLRYRLEQPETKDALLKQWRSGLLAPFHYDNFPSGHKPTDFSRWVLANSTYEINYSEFFEPYLVLERQFLPKYDEIFVGRYYDKISHSFKINFAGFKFLVSSESFLVHIYHKPVGHSKISLRCAKEIYDKYKEEMMNNMSSNR